MGSVFFNTFFKKNQSNQFKIENNHKLIKRICFEPNIKLIKEEGTNVYDLFKYKNVIMTSSSVKKIQNRILNEKN